MGGACQPSARSPEEARVGGGSAAEAPNMAGNGGHGDKWTATPPGEKDLGGASRGAEIVRWW